MSLYEEVIAEVVIGLTKVIASCPAHGSNCEVFVERLISERGRPENVRSDNGSEFTSRRMLAWAED
jgi:hypothetical protein